MSLLSPSLEAFWAIVQAGTVLEAAKRIKLTQTGVTQRIRGLEKQLGVTLFTRSRNGMRLTSEGEALLRYVRAARDLEGDTLAQMTGKVTNVVTEVCLSGTSTLMRSRIIPRVSQVIMAYPHLRLRFDLSEADSIPGKLKSGFAQIGILPTNQVALELDSRVLAPERYVLVGPSRWKKRELEDILAHECIVDFDPNDTITFDLLRKYKLHKFASSNRHYANNIDALTSMLVHGVGYSALTTEFAKEFVQSGSLAVMDKDLYLDHPVAIAWYARTEMPRYFKDLIEAITKA